MTARRERHALTLSPLDNRALANLCGPLDANLRQIEAALDVAIAHRGGEFTLTGTSAHAARASEALQRFYAAAEKPLSVDDIQLGLIELATQKDAAEAAIEEETAPLLRTRRADLHGRTPNQTRYLRDIQEHDITFGIGPAGTGKTYLAVACAVDALERDVVKRLVLVRPAVEAGERLGFLPGDLAQKVDPYLRPLYDALYDLLGFDKTGKLFERSTIGIAPLAQIRGCLPRRPVGAGGKLRRRTPARSVCVLSARAKSKHLTGSTVARTIRPTSLRSCTMTSVRWLATSCSARPCCGGKRVRRASR